MTSQRIIEKRLVQNLLRLEICTVESKDNPRRVNYCLGFRKGISLLNIENSINSYFKVLNIIKEIKKTKKSILFIGYPFGLEKKLKTFFSEPHKILTGKEWFYGVLLCSSLLRIKRYFVITFCDGFFPSFSNCFAKSIPIAKFIFELKNKTFTDYPILLNLRSKGTIGLFLYLISKA